MKINIDEALRYLDSIKERRRDFDSMIDSHNFIVAHINREGPGFFGRRKLKRALKHLTSSHYRRYER